LVKCRDNNNLEMQQRNIGGNIISVRNRRVIKRISPDQCRKIEEEDENLSVTLG
jgi:hypothetical protein